MNTCEIKVLNVIILHYIKFLTLDSNFDFNGGNLFFAIHCTSADTSLYRNSLCMFLRKIN